MNNIGDRLIEKTKQRISGRFKDDKDNDFENDEKDRMSGNDGRDLLTTLVRSNMDSDLPDSQRMTDLAIRGRE